MKFKMLAICCLGATLSGCDLDSASENEQKVKITATGITKTVRLREANSGLKFNIETDGEHEIELQNAAGTFNFEILSGIKEDCKLNEKMELSCKNERACTAVIAPTCAKEPDAGILDDGAGLSDRYKTFHHPCSAMNDGAWIAHEGRCDRLEDKVAKPIEPVKMIVPFSFVRFPDSDAYELKNFQIENNTAIVTIAYQGGCGAYDLRFVVAATFEETSPVKLKNRLLFSDNDSCEALTTIEKSFDLLPIREQFIKSYPQEFGKQTVVLEGFGEYSFTIE